MANGDISGEEWLELYRYLLSELEKRGFNEVRTEIETAASAPVVEESTPEDEARISKLVRGEVGKAIIRRRSPEEVFAAAIGVLRSRLVELPTLGAALSKHLGVTTDHIEFRVDYEQRYALVESEPVRLNQLIVSEGDSNSLRAALSAFGPPMDQVGG
jgi:transcription initiation factor TFIIIB Brf1 subunit/transcription initiation factor TFIIB